MSSNNNRRRRPPRPAGAPAPQDFRSPKKSAAQREAEGVETVDIDWRGMRFTIPAHAEDWDFWSVTRHMSQNNFPEACLGLIGPRGIAQIHREFPRISNARAGELFGELFQAITKAVGFGNAGN
ncbi:hypothetical protein [Nocardia sp. NPDC059239]|uniref:hypothetical protein n=1 Tax=unclassified Nocardia TaxID=2637762 RepID=UPI0036CBE3C4